MTYRIIDLFSGAGGMTLGFVAKEFCGGFRSILAIDSDRAATETYSLNFGGHGIWADIEDWLLSNSVPQAEVVIGGPPCQGFSLLNKKRVGDKRRALWEPYLDIVEQSGASVFVMENVAELLASGEFQSIERRAVNLGFKVTAAILNAANYGAPQSRRRTIILGSKTGTYSQHFPPKSTHSDPKEKQTKLPPWRTVKDAIADLPRKTIGTEIGVDIPLGLHFGRSPTAVSMARYKAVPSGGNRFDLQQNAPHITPVCWIKKKSGGTDLFGRLWWDRPSVTIRTEFFKPEKGRYLHPVAHRPITHREAARLMGFPDKFLFQGNKIEIARQIGNAVPPPFAGAIARMVKAVLDESRKRKRELSSKAIEVVL